MTSVLELSEREEIIRAHFFDSVMALGPFIGEQCGAGPNVRLVLEDDLATSLADCGEDEDWQMFGYYVSRLTIDGELVCIEYGSCAYPDGWSFMWGCDISMAAYQINVHNATQGGMAFSTIATVEKVDQNNYI